MIRSLTYCLLLLSLAAVANAQRSETPRRTLTPSLLDDLPEVVPPAESPADQAGRTDQPTGSASPLTLLSRQMQRAGQQLRQPNSTPDAKRLQVDIIAQLDRLLANAKQQSSAEGQQATGGQSQPSSGSGGTVGSRAGLGSEGGKHSAAVPFSRESVQRLWGQLPDQVQQQIQTPVHEDFLPAYRELIEKFYKRLATHEDR